MTTVRSLGGGAPCLLALALCLTAVPAPAQSLPRRIDCGDQNGWGWTEPGYELLSEVAAPPGVALIPAPLDTVHVAGNQPNYYGEFPREADMIAVDADQLGQVHRLTGLQLADPTILRLDGLAPSAPHRIKLELGALAPWTELDDPYNPPYWAFFSTVSRDVRIERRDATGAGPWQTARSGIRCSSNYKGPSFESILGGIVDVWVLAFSNAAGRLELRLSTDGADPLFLSGFEVHAYEGLPVMYRRNGDGPLEPLSPTVEPFVAAFNGGDLQQAADIARLLPDAFERGVCQLHLMGWLDGSRDGFLHLRDEAGEALAQALPEHPAAAWLLDELEAFGRALDHLFASGRTLGHTCPSEGGLGFLTTECAPLSLNIDSLTRTNVNAHIAVRELAGLIAPVDGPTVLHDLVDWNAGSLSPLDWEPSPLVFQAAKLVGTNLASMNPQWAPGEGEDAEAFAALRDGLLRGFLDLGFAASDFPDDLELRLFDLWTDQGVLPVSWPLEDYEDLFSEEELAASWWGPLVDLPPATPGAPAWADLLRHQRLLLRALAHDWLVERLEAGEFGGGLGDDVELLNQFGKLFVGHQSPGDQPALDGLDTLVRWTLGGSGDVEGGYFTGLTDVEHSAEYTTNTWSALASAFGQTATGARLALEVTEHLRSTADPSQAWAAPTALGRLHLRGYSFNTDGPNEAPQYAWDTLLNGRALLPGWGTSRRGLLAVDHPLVTDLGDWARAWRDDALTPGAAKPEGWYGPVHWPSNALGNGGWWTHKADPADEFELGGGVHSYTLDLLRAAYERSTASDRWRFLLPGVRMFRTVMDWEDGLLPANGAPGSASWAAATFKDSQRFGQIVASWWGDLAEDPDLTTLPDPKNPGSTYVDGALLGRLATWVQQENNGQLPVTRYVYGDIQPCGAGFTAKSTLMFTGSYEKAIAYYRLLFPLLTKHVIHTDRIALGAGLSHLAVAETGANLVEGIAHRPLVRWRDLGGADQDFVVQCNYRDPAGTVYSAFVYNFEPGQIDTAVLLDVGLQPGTYQVSWGWGDPKCDLFQPGALGQQLLVDKRGLSARAELTLDPGLSLVRLERIGPASAPAARYDLAVDPPWAAVVAGPSGPVLRLEAVIANPGAAPSPQASATLHVAALDGHGQPVGPEVPLHTELVPSLPACSGWSLPQHVLRVDVPLGAPPPLLGRGGSRAGGQVVGGGPAGPVAGPATGPAVGPGATPGGAAGGLGATALVDLLGEGLGLRLRIQVAGGADESDVLNNEATRGWSQAQMLEAAFLAGD